MSRIDGEVLDTFYSQLRCWRARCSRRRGQIDHRVSGEHDCERSTGTSVTGSPGRELGRGVDRGAVVRIARPCSSAPDSARRGSRSRAARRAVGVRSASADTPAPSNVRPGGVIGPPPQPGPRSSEKAAHRSACWMSAPTCDGQPCTDVPDRPGDRVMDHRRADAGGVRGRALPQEVRRRRPRTQDEWWRSAPTRLRRNLEQHPRRGLAEHDHAGRSHDPAHELGHATTTTEAYSHHERVIVYGESPPGAPKERR